MEKQCSKGKRRKWRGFLSICMALLMLCNVSSSVFAGSVEQTVADELKVQPEPAVTYEFYTEGALYHSQTVKNGEELKEPPAPQKSGSVFDGWFTSESCEEKFTDFSAKEVTKSETVSLYAGWSAQTQEEQLVQEEAPAQEEPQTQEEPAAAPSSDAEEGMGRAISGPKEVNVGGTIQLTGASGNTHNWSASPAGLVTISPTNNQTVNVTGVKAGTVTITHTYRSRVGGRQQTETYTIQVLGSGGTDTKGEQLYIYTVIPGKDMNAGGSADLIWNGMGIGSISGVGRPSDHTIGDILDNGYGDSGAVIDYKEDQFPPITVNGRQYQYARTEEQKYQEGYYTIKWIRVVVSEGANAGNNDYNQPTVDGKIPMFHLDGYIILNEKNSYTVDFMLKDAGDDTFKPVDPEKYTQRVDAGTSASSLKRPETNEPNLYPRTKVVNGITYQLDCWYYDEACTQKVDFNKEVINSNTTYYGKYVPAGKHITVSKEVTGSLGNKDKIFNFTYSYSGGSGSFNLKSGEKCVIQNVPIDAELTIKETNAKGYVTTAKYGNTTVSATDAADSQEKTVKVTISAADDKIVITNHRDWTPDTGIDLKMLPSLLTFAAVVLTAAVFFIGKYRRKHF